MQQKVEIMYTLVSVLKYSKIFFKVRSSLDLFKHISITGIAGPKGGSKQKKIGLVYIGIKIGKKVVVNKCNFKNKGRAYIQRQTVKKSLNLLLRLIKQGN